jgi:hypothetical protein
MQENCFAVIGFSCSMMLAIWRAEVALITEEKHSASLWCLPLDRRGTYRMKRKELFRPRDSDACHAGLMTRNLHAPKWSVACQRDGAPQCTTRLEPALRCSTSHWKRATVRSGAALGFWRDRAYPTIGQTSVSVLPVILILRDRAESAFLLI